MTRSSLHAPGAMEGATDHQHQGVTSASAHRQVPSRPGRAAGANHSGFYLGATGVLIIIVLLELLPRVGVVDRRFLPPFSERV